MKYIIDVKGSLSVGGKRFTGGQVYEEKELGDIKALKGLVKPIEEPKDEMSLKELEVFIQDLEVPDLEDLLKEEVNGENRKGAIKLLENKIKELKDA